MEERKNLYGAAASERRSRSDLRERFREGRRLQRMIRDEEKKGKRVLLTWEGLENLRARGDPPLIDERKRSLNLISADRHFCVEQPLIIHYHSSVATKIDLHSPATARRSCNTR